MRTHTLLRWLLACGAVAALAPWSAPLVAQPRQQPPTIQSLTNPGEQLVVTAAAPDTGVVTFAASPEGLLLPVDAAQPAAVRALQFVELYGAQFGLTDPSQLRVLAVPPADSLGVEHVKFQQLHQGVPVRGGEFIVHLRGARALAANGHVTTDLPESVVPEIAGNVALAEAIQLIAVEQPENAADARYSEPRLEIFNRALLSEAVSYGSRLAWFIEATGFALREYIWVDAQTGGVLLNFSQLTNAKARTVYNANYGSALPGTLMRSEGQPATGDADADHAYDFAGITYDYFFTHHGRDSYDNAGAAIVSSVHYGMTQTYPNAFWNGTQLVYGDGFASADDVVAHEFTHAVTEKTAGLFNYQQSGALNESFSDIFGETVDLTDSVGNDTDAVRWKLGEDLATGPVRDMMKPETYGQLGRLGGAFIPCSSDVWGGFRFIGVPNHAFALMVDGIPTGGNGIGLHKAAKIWYRALTVYLTSGSTLLDTYFAVNQSCADLTGTTGIVSNDCVHVRTALDAVEMSEPLSCAATPPSMCPTGGVATPLFRDGFESDLAGWSTSSSGAGTWQRDTSITKTGRYAAHGTEPRTPSNHALTMASAITIPAGGRLYFDHAFDLRHFSDNQGPFDDKWYDFAVLEFSTNNGATWIDARSMIDGGQTYNETAFLNTSFGYTATRLNLGSLVGQAVKFRFRIARGGSAVPWPFPWVGFGWAIDNVTIYTCEPSPALPSQPTAVTALPGVRRATVSFIPPVSDGGTPIASYEVTSSSGNVTRTGASSPIVVSGLTNGIAYTFRVTATNSMGTSVPSEPSAPVIPATIPDPPTAVSAVDDTLEGRQVTVRFLPPANDGGSAITTFSVTSSPGNVIASGQTSPITVTGLINGTSYTFTVTATNAYGTSTPSAPSAAVTPATFPGSPTNLHAVAGNGQITVTFSPPPDDGGAPITSYQASAGSFYADPDAKPGHAFGSSSPITVTGLTTGKPYAIGVLAINRKGWGVDTVIGPVTPATVPDAPTAVVAVRGNAQATITFLPPTSNGGAAITSYTASASPGDATASASGSPITVAGLTNGTTYTFRVTATNGVGTSVQSAPSAPVTPIGPPGPPRNISVVGGRFSATVSFAPPDSNGGAPITSYTATARFYICHPSDPPSGCRLEATFTRSGSSSPLVLTGLSSQECLPRPSSYVFTVTATNAAGTGVPSAEAVAGVCGPVNVPNPPTMLSATPSDREVTVTFTPPLSTYCNSADSYTITASPGGVTATGFSSPITVTGLTNGVAYTFTVTASNYLGTSKPSSPSPAVIPGFPGTPADFALAAAGWNVLATWTSTGSTATAHALDVALDPSFAHVVLSVPLGAGTAASLEAPPHIVGTFYSRLTARNADGVSAPTSVVALTLPGVAAQPGAPVLRDATVTGNNVALNWTPSRGGAPTSYVLAVGSAPSATDIGMFPMAMATSVSTAVPANPYYVRVVAINAAGYAVSNEIAVSVGAACVAPGPPLNLTAAANGRTINVAWTPPTSGSGPLSYSIAAGSSAGASDIGTFPVGSVLSVSAPVQPKTYFLRVRAANACGVSDASVEVIVIVP